MGTVAAAEDKTRMRWRQTEWDGVGPQVQLEYREGEMRRGNMRLQMYDFGGV